MAVASPRRPKYSVWRNGVSVSLAAEAAERARLDVERKRDLARRDFEDRQFAAPDFIPDDGFDHRDAADSTCIGFASPSIGERDPNADYHDRYLGCFDR